MADGVKILAQVKLSKITLVNSSKFAALPAVFLTNRPSYHGRIPCKILCNFKVFFFFLLENVRFIKMNMTNRPIIKKTRLIVIGLMHRN